ncbi:TetR/AcrR family transcriptional regulator [Actinomadura sp. ATCC 31491]|uniref:TetR/AcrR family transcriptional regulator n=1 Tax=Actinomadura luzonensis TaxID=2805427 RepID=A0ABT0G6R7_9ACTN|nr:TetR/AcrR family transcriptional regulator [Actinomadura luzonensis]MCK2220267.1 TetR/AcrR family transcriptional regulator [Actinomadura luzonensis]
MSPRGVTIPEVRQQLFDAAERVLLREGPSGMSGRAITREAGVATGLLYNHFTDLDAFLAALIVDRAGAATGRLRDLPVRAGSGTVAGNVLAAIDSLLTGNLLALAGLTLARPTVVPRLAQALGDGTLEPDAGERLFTAYLEAEQRLGRLPAEADPASLALALVGAAHQLVLTRGPRSPELGERMRRLVGTLLPAAP